MDPIVSVDKQAKPYQHVGYGPLRPLTWAYRVGFISDTDTTLLCSDIINILLTPRGWWRWKPLFGCDLYKVVFEPNDDLAFAVGAAYIEDALIRQERRVSNVRVQGTSDENTLRFSVTFTISKTNRTGNLVVVLKKGEQ